MLEAFRKRLLRKPFQSQVVQANTKVDINENCSLICYVNNKPTRGLCRYRMWSNTHQKERCMEVTYSPTPPRYNMVNEGNRIRLRRN